MIKKFILVFVIAFTFSAFFTSCRETSESTNIEVSDDLQEVGEDVESAAEDVGNSIEQAAEDVEKEVSTDDF